MTWQRHIEWSVRRWEYQKKVVGVEWMMWQRHIEWSVRRCVGIEWMKWHIEWSVHRWEYLRKRLLALNG